MRKALLLVFTLLMLASFSFGIVFAAAQKRIDENGWFQNQNMSALKTNEEGASEFTLGGSVPTYNRTEIDLNENKLSVFPYYERRLDRFSFD